MVNSAGPQSLTREWADALKDLHESPYAWFHGHLLRYILRLAPSVFRDRVSRDIAAITPCPLAGLHIRRTDKLIYEAKIQPISQYMLEVQRYYKEAGLEGRLIRGEMAYEPEKNSIFSNRRSGRICQRNALVPTISIFQVPIQRSLDFSSQPRRS